MVNAMTIDVDKLETIGNEELARIRDRATEILERRAEEERKKDIDRIRELVKKHNFTDTELTSVVLSNFKGRQIGIAQYAHPENSKLTWTGTGRKPKWFQQLLDQGYEAEQLRIKPAAQ